MAPIQKVVITRQLIPKAQKILEEVQGLEIFQWPSDQPCERSWLLEHVPGAAGILLMLSDKCDEELISTAGDQLKVVASFSVGIDHVDKKALQNRNIRLGYTPPCLTDAVADLAIMLILMAQRRGGEAMAKVLAGEWPQMPWHPLLMTGPQIRGCTVGFLGFGRIAQATLKRLLPFGIKRAIYITSRPGKIVKEVADQPGLESDSVTSTGQLASESDVVIVGCPLTPDTKHIVNADFFSQMKKTAVLINIARGPVVDTDALTNALANQRVFGAGLDVIENEPNISADHPLLKQPRCVLMPHIGSATIETREDMATESVKNLLAGLRGEKMVNEYEL